MFYSGVRHRCGGFVFIYAWLDVKASDFYLLCEPVGGGGKAEIYAF